MGQKTLLHVYDKTPFRNDYSDPIMFKDLKEQLYFFNDYGIKNNMLNEIHTSKEVNRVKKQSNTINISKDFSECQYATYMRYYNERDKKWVFCFIQSVSEIRENLSQIYYEEDVFNTRMFDVLKQPRIMGHILQKTTDKPNKNIQGINVGEKVLYGVEVLDTKINWAVFQLLPSAVISDKDNRKGKSSYISTIKNTRFFIFPIFENSEYTIPFKYEGKEYKSMNLNDIIEHLSNKFEGKVNTVNQVVHAYTTKDIGIKYKYNEPVGGQPPSIEIEKVPYLGLTIHAIGGTDNGNGDGDGGNNGGTGGTGKAPVTNKELMEKPVDETYTDISDDKMYSDVINFPRVKYHGMSKDDCKKVSEIVEKNGMSRNLFWSYEKSEGMGYNEATGQPWGWLNHTVQQGDVFKDAEFVAKKVVAQCSVGNPVPLAWVDSYHNNNQPSAEVQAKGQKEANEFKNPSFGRGFVGLTAASTWSIWAPEFLTAEYNGVTDYADPWATMLNTFKKWK